MFLNVFSVLVVIGYYWIIVFRGDERIYEIFLNIWFGSS